MVGGGPGAPRRRVGTGLRIYAGVLFAAALAIARFGEYPFSLIAWGVAAVAAVFVAVFIVLPAMRG